MKNLGMLCLVLCACGGSSSSTPDAGYAMLNPIGSFDPGFTPTNPNKPATVYVTASGETLGENGLPFHSVTCGDPQYVDGWDVSFDKYIVVVGNVRLTAPSATQYSNQNQVNAVVASKPGPYVIDFHLLKNSGNNGFTGEDGEEPAGGIFKWDTLDDGSAFDTSKLYAFSYDTVAASYPATQVNLTQDEVAIYDQMVTNHWDKYIEAHATFVGTEGTTPPWSPSIQTEFAAFPHVVHFVFGWNDATSSVNCINPDNGDMDEANLANRGIQPKSSGAVIAQITVHTDHVFWDELEHEGAPLRMDPLAAWAPADTSVTPLDLGTLGTKPLAITFADGTPMPDRAPYMTNPCGAFTSDQSAPDTQIVYNLNGVPAGNIAGITNFMAFSAQSQTHLNANGLCYIVGQQATDPWYVPNVIP